MRRRFKPKRFSKRGGFKRRGRSRFKRRATRGIRIGYRW